MLPTHPADRSIPQDYLHRVPDAADRLGISLRATWRLIATGQIRAVKVGLRSTRIAESELTRFMANLSEAR